MQTTLMIKMLEKIVADREAIFAVLDVWQDSIGRSDWSRVGDDWKKVSVDEGILSEPMTEEEKAFILHMYKLADFIDLKEEELMKMEVRGYD